MSLFGSIGKKLGGFVHKITGFADTALSFLRKPLDFLMKPVQGLVHKVLDKLPFGIGKFVEPFADKFLSSAVGWLAGGPLGGILATLNNVGNVVEKVDNVLHVVDGALNGGVKSLPEPAKQNAQEAFSWAHAQSLLA